jgi:hypothetical protein
MPLGVTTLSINQGVTKDIHITNGRSNVNGRSNLVGFAGCAAKPFPEYCYLIKRVAAEGTER